MTNKCILQIALLLCFSTTALSLSYPVLGFQQRRSILACRMFLWQLNGSVENCLEDRVDFKVPEEIEQPQGYQKEEAVFVIHEMLQQIYDIFRRNISSTGWNEIFIKNLYRELNWQMNHLQAALEEILEENNFTWEKSKTLLDLKQYYLRIVQYLKANLYSRCAWTMVQVEILGNFSFLYRLMDYLQILNISPSVSLGRSNANQNFGHSSANHSD